MAEITLQNTKAEIFAAYEAAQNAVCELSEKLASLSEELNTANNKFAEFTAQIADIPEMPEAILSDTEQQVTVCIPYVKALAQGNELQLALRGWDLNFRENFNVVIIGDREDWMNDLVHVIECERISKNPPLDVVNKMLLAINSDQVTEKFIWANDDQYLVSPCMLADFEILKCAGRLGETDFGSSLYQQNKAKTAALLLRENLSTIDFSTHIPVVFEKQKLKEVIEKYNLVEDPHLVTTIYHNYWFPGFVPYNSEIPEALENDNLKVGVYRKGADLDRLKRLIPRKKLVSNSESGWSPKLSEILNSFFSFKCKFEN
jgi:hypothetical protein